MERRSIEDVPMPRQFLSGGPLTEKGGIEKKMSWSREPRKAPEQRRGPDVV